MDNWLPFGKPKEVEDKKSSILKDYIVPLGALLIPAMTYLTEHASSWLGALAIAVYMAIVVIFLVVPAIMRVGRKWLAYSKRRQLEGNFRPKISASISRFKPMMESNRSDTIWYVWNRSSMTSEMRTFIRPSQSNYYALVAWLNCLSQTVDSGKSANFKFVASETSTWIQQYISFCRDAYSQFEDLLRNSKLDDANAREIRKDWNHARDEHNQAIISWKALCAEINASFGQSICSEHFETLKPLE